jgi:hypothetical protein
MASTKVQRIMTQPIVSYLSVVRGLPLCACLIFCVFFFIHIVVLFLIGLALRFMLWFANPWWACAAAEPHLPFPPDRKWIAKFCPVN